MSDTDLKDLALSEGALGELFEKLLARNLRIKSYACDLELDVYRYTPENDEWNGHGLAGMKVQQTRGLHLEPEVCIPGPRGLPGFAPLVPYDVLVVRGSGPVFLVENLSTYCELHVDAYGPRDGLSWVDKTLPEWSYTADPGKATGGGFQPWYGYAPIKPYDIHWEIRLRTALLAPQP